MFIAEIGYNHGGSLKKARTLVDALSNFKLVTFIKFQIDPPEDLYHPVYTKRYYELIKEVSLTFDEYVELWDYILSKGKIPLFSTSSAKVVEDFPRRLEFLKIASGSVFNFPIYRAIKKRKELKKVFISLGAVTPEEEKFLVDYLNKEKIPYHLLHCVSKYPTHPLESKLEKITLLKEKYNLSKVGYSDHTATKEVILAAYLLGAEPIELHVMLDNDDQAVEKSVSYTIGQLKEIEQTILLWEKNRKEPELVPSFTRRALYSAGDLKKREILTLDKVKFIRPLVEGGIKDIDWFKVEGKKLKRDIQAGEPIRWEDIDGI